MFALLWVLSITFSIAVAEASLWVAAAAFGIAWLRRELDADALTPAERAPGPAGDVLALVGAPIIVFFTLSFIAAFFSRDRVESLLELREVFLFAAPLVTWAAFRDLGQRDRGRGAFAIGILGAVAVGIYQTATEVPAPGDLVYRASGPLGHYMTFSGVLLIAVPLLLTVRGRVAGLAARIVAALAVAMIGLTFTRSAWIGVGVAIAVYVACGRVGAAAVRPASPADPKRRAASIAATSVAGIVIIAVVLGAIAGPDALYARASSTFSLEDPSNRDRLAMAATGFKIIKAHPWLGIGPGVMEQVYPAWVVDWAVHESNPHLHNNVLHIAAERGVLGLGAWLWMIAAFALAAWRVLRAEGPGGRGGPEARAALAALAGFLAMGMFEYNFSDSEVLMSLLYVVSLPLAATAGRENGAGDDD